MAEFKLDTSGAVHETQDNPPRFYPAPCMWSDLSPFVQGYIEALLRGYSDKWTGDGFYGAVAEGCAFSDLAPETMARIMEDCAKIAALISGLDERDGRDIWNSRRKGFPGAGTVTEYMRANFPPLTVYLGDDGKVRLK